MRSPPVTPTLRPRSPSFTATRTFHPGQPGPGHGHEGFLDRPRRRARRTIPPTERLISSRTTNGYTGLSNSPPAFTDGERFYYFITARDVLGRDGLVSPGGPAEACPPHSAPGRRRMCACKTSITSGPTNQQTLMVTWQQNTQLASDLVSEYWIYRWPNPADVPDQRCDALQRPGRHRWRNCSGRT